jgi:hypothetical protein
MFMKLGMYIMTPEPISKAYFINPSHESVCLQVHLLIVARQRLGKNFAVAMNTQATIKIVGRVVFYAVRVVSEETRPLVLPRTSRLVQLYNTGKDFHYLELLAYNLRGACHLQWTRPFPEK